jgi:hypothetical protein
MQSIDLASGPVWLVTDQEREGIVELPLRMEEITCAT